MTWSTDILPPLLAEADKLGLAVIKIHSHLHPSPFSSVDDRSDRDLFPSVHAWTDNEPHGSAIMFGNGQMIGRTVDAQGKFQEFTSVNVVGDDLLFWHSESCKAIVRESGRRVAQTFGRGTYECLQKLRVGIVGCSGTGSPLIEQLARNCVGELVLVDPDHVKERNLNRIVNATMEDVRQSRLKVDVAARSIHAMELGTKVEKYPHNLFHPAVVNAIAECDVLFLDVWIQ